jgi:hypothetical protein
MKTANQLDTEVLHSFYTHAVLPQFGFRDQTISWSESRRLEADEFAHFLAIDGIAHVLVWEDYEGAGSNADFIKQHITNGADFEFIQPTSHTSIAPSYDGFRLPTPSQYCENIIGSFTLIKLASPALH